MKFELKNQKETIVTCLKYLLMFGLYFLVHYRFLGDFWFNTDELDVMCGGKNIASGHLLYGEFYSQHMPFSYYLSALFDFLGAKTVPAQRVSFYAFYALMWTIINIRYKDVVNKVALFVYPLLFSSLICCYDMGTVILSEHLAGIGFVILYLELISFLKKKEINIFNCILISLAVLLTFGTVFIGAFGVFVIAVAVFIKEIWWRVERKEKFTQMIVSMVKKFALLIGCVAAPWVVLITSYLIKGNLGEFVFQAYVLNREVYSKYTGGYGSDIMSAVIGCVDTVASNFLGLFTVNEITSTTVVFLLVFVLIAVYLIHLFEKKNAYLGVTTIFFLMAVGIRGYFNYHGTQWVAIASLIMSLAIFEVLVENKEVFCEKNVWYKVAVVMIVFTIFSKYLVSFSAITNSDEAMEDIGVNDRSIIIEAVTEEDEAVWQLDFSNYLFMAADRPAIRNVGATPWFWEAVGLTTLEIVREDMPRVATYSAGQETWGQKLADYAPELIVFMAENYTQYEGTEIHIRNDYYEEACKKIAEVQQSVVTE